MYTYRYDIIGIPNTYITATVALEAITIVVIIIIAIVMKAITINHANTDMVVPISV